MSKFDTIYESAVERMQSGGFIIGDRVRFKKDAYKDEYVQSRSSSFQEYIKACCEDTFDLNLRIGAIKSIYPTTSQNYQGGVTDSPQSLFADVFIEHAPGLFARPVTVPISLLILMDDSINRGPIPDSLRRKNKIHGPEELKAEPDDLKAEINLKNQNVVLPNSNKWDDTQPGGGNFRVKS